jgi:sodium/pantothenate symporter
VTAAALVAWTLFGIYLVATFWLAWLGHRRTKSFEDFAVGGRDMGPGMAGLTLGACLASTATFVINPGFVYAYGLPALLALTLPLFGGIFAGLAVMGPGFRRHGGQATTLPVWIGQRFGSQGLRAWFAALCLLHVFYVVLVVVGASYVMSVSMGVSYPWAVTIVVGVVFSYVFLGGTYAHAYTNTAQGLIMLVVAAVIFGYALRDMGGPSDALAALAAQDVNLVGLTHPQSPFYRHWVEVLVCPFLVGFALVAQPHLLVKTLYLKRTRDMARFAVTGGACFVVFSLVLFAGLAARLQLGGGLNQDVAAATWLAGAFPPILGSVVSVAILAAAMSTLDGLLVAVSSIVGADLVAHPAVAGKFGADTEEARGLLALRAGRVTVIVLGVVAWGVAMDPPALVGIFGTIGTYGLLVASLPPVLYGVLSKRPPAAAGIAVASVVGLAVHLGLYYGGWTINTGLTATLATLVSLPIPALFRRPAPLEAVGPRAEPALELVGAGSSSASGRFMVE